METFMYRGMEYPKDSIYAEEMCKHMFAPDFSSYSLDLLENTKEYGGQNNMTSEQMAVYLKNKNDNKPPLGTTEELSNAIDGFLKTKKD